MNIEELREHVRTLAGEMEDLYTERVALENEIKWAEGKLQDFEDELYSRI